MLPVAILIFAQAGAWTGVRPPECAAFDGARASNVWERAKAPDLRKYCDLVASANARLAGADANTREALAIADEADRALPGHAAPRVLRGRALSKMGRAQEALDALAAAAKIDERALDEPSALLAWARANGRTSHTDEASRAYRALLPRASALPAAERGAAALEAGLLAMSRGPAGIDDATELLRQARRDAQDATQAVSAAALALALDRAGATAEARAVLAEGARGDLRAALADAQVTSALANAGASAEADALLGLALEVREPKSASDAWTRYLAGQGGHGPWADSARAHLHGGGATKKPRGNP